MTKRFLLGDNIHVDTQRLVDTRLLIQANSGGGKSWCLRRILEQTNGQLQHLVIDLEGEFASLRERFDYILAAKSGGDTAADVRASRLLAERLLELGVSAVLDIYELKADERIRFVRGFLEALVDAPKRLWHPALVVVDEAHVFCPENAKAESAGAVIDLATRGRKRGFCSVLATQRLAKLHKDAAAECNNKLIGRTGLDVDLKRAADELGFGKDRWPELRNLTEGSFFAFGPAISRTVIQVRVGEVLTSHPKAGARLAFSAPPPTEKVRALLPKLADLPAEQEQRAKTEADLKREISTLKRELAAKPKPIEVKAVEQKRVEVQVLGDKQIDRLQKTFGALREDLDKYESRIAGRFAAVTKALGDVAAALAKVGRNGHAVEPRPQMRRDFSRPPAPPRPKAPQASGELGKGERVILTAIAQRQVGATRQELTVLTGYKRSSRDTYLQRLRAAGYVDETGDRLTVTDVGLEALGPDVEQLPTGDELREHWLQKLPAGERVVLEAVIAAYPNAVRREDLEVDYQRSSRDTYLQRLSARKLVETPGPGLVRASEELFG